MFAPWTAVASSTSDLEAPLSSASHRSFVTAALWKHNRKARSSRQKAVEAQSKGSVFATKSSGKAAEALANGEAVEALARRHRFILASASAEW